MTKGFVFGCIATKANTIIVKDLNKAAPEVTNTKSVFVSFLTV